MERLATENGRAPFTTADVEAVLEAVRPALARHGGDIDLVCVDGCDVRVTLRGACVGCPSSATTLRFEVERRMREELPGFGSLIAEEGRTPRENAGWWRWLIS
jgi:Fe-S cluster biogenesis protein NfuA